ncbi:2-hydroxycarboxylate transporter family protein [Pectobacterium cacticida]|uniref:2-hydroxycarboxylate transporter family protein n=1 Tax=Pectobacterium cacticida TaxID=69221 RepID=A0ABZ2GG57_9GAMM|nr:2-hydroxycarboxylate transporter family protein [Pectobacterium cacticida]UYX05738.1 2-hydroxycarboxylate transporter family protein [Pectobacterium cacticida]
MFTNIKIGGMPAKYFIIFAVVVLLATYTGTLNKDIVGTIAFLLVCGGFFAYIGKIIPIFGSYMGGAVLLPLFGGSILVYFGLIPEFLKGNVASLMSSGAVNLFIAAIIVGSILSMNQKMLVSVTVRLLPCILVSLLFAVIFMFMGCLATGKTVLDGLFMVGLPNYTGGSAGALVIVPTIYSEFFNESVGSFAGRLIVFMNISNLICVIFSGLLNRLGKSKPELTGNGVLIKNHGTSFEKSEKENHAMDTNLTKLGTGLLVSTVFLIVGNMLQYLVPQLNFIAWSAILVVFVKALGLLDDQICRCSEYWQSFMVGNFLPVLITAVGISSLDFYQLASYFTLSNFLIIFLGVIGSMIGSLLCARFFNFYPIDSMLAVGVQMGTVGGSGAVATLSTAERMSLMPFAIISNRIGGALVVILINLVIPYFI